MVVVVVEWVVTNVVVDLICIAIVVREGVGVIVMDVVATAAAVEHVVLLLGLWPSMFVDIVDVTLAIGALIC